MHDSSLGLKANKTQKSNVIDGEVIELMELTVISPVCLYVRKPYPRVHGCQKRKKSYGRRSETWQRGNYELRIH